MSDFALQLPSEQVSVLKFLLPLILSIFEEKLHSRSEELATGSSSRMQSNYN